MSLTATVFEKKIYFVLVGKPRFVGYPLEILLISLKILQKKFLGTVAVRDI